VIKNHKNGLGYAKISKKLDIPKSSVQYIVNKYIKTGSIFTSPRKGRPKLCNSRTERVILKTVKANRRVTASEIKDDLQLYHNITVNAQTVRNVIKSSGLNGRIARKKPYISPKNKAVRLKYAMETQLLSDDLWKRVIFTDESSFSMNGTRSKQYVWRKPGEEMLPECTVPTFKHGTGKVMVWGAISYNGFFRLHFVTENVNSRNYLTLMKKFFNDYDHNEDIIFMQDNAPPHKAATVMRFFEEKGISLLHHPPQSPDLNPIEHVWDYMSKKLVKDPPK
jgi:transposase